jgi:hypothetical protein
MNKQEIEKAIERLEALSRYAQILKDPSEFFHHMNGHTTELSLVIAAFNIAEMAQDIQKELTQQLTNEWIPCKDALPIARQHESGEPIEYNIMLRGGTVATTGIITPESIWGWMNWNDYKFYPIGVDVIAWQPLPEPFIQPSTDTE